MDSSGLLRLPDGSFLTINDKDGAVYSMRPDTNRSDVDLTLATNLFSPAALHQFAALKHGHYDGEGLGRDGQGWIYMCEESDRWILRCDPSTGKVERLNIDWSPVTQFFSTDLNASFEGIAIDGNRLWVANERNVGRIILVDLTTLKVVEWFQALPWRRFSNDVHYSDLCFFKGDLWVLCRDSFCVVRMNPNNHQMLGHYDYRDLERSPNQVYAQPTAFGFTEGLSVDDEWIWLVVDNNGFPRVAALNDSRSTLWRCRRPDIKH